MEDEEAQPLSEKEKDEAKLMFELCDSEGQKEITLTDFAKMCMDNRYVASFVGVRDASAEDALQKLVSKAGKDKLSWDEFETMITQMHSGRGDVPRLSDEQELDLIFDNCDILRQGEIHKAAFVALCVKHPTVAKVLGFKPKQTGDGKAAKRIGQDELFAQIDTDGSGQVTRNELRAFVWKQRAQAVDAATKQAPMEELPLCEEKEVSLKEEVPGDAFTTQQAKDAKDQAPPTSSGVSSAPTTSEASPPSSFVSQDGGDKGKGGKGSGKGNKKNRNRRR